MSNNEPAVPAVNADARIWWMTDGRQHCWVGDVGEASDAERRGWTPLVVIEIPEPIRVQLDVIRADTLAVADIDADDLTTYGDVLDYALDGCYLAPWGKPGAAEYDPGEDPVSIAYAIVLGYEQGLTHLTQHLRLAVDR